MAAAGRLGPELPRCYYDGGTDTRVRFLKATRVWYETWRCSPQATRLSTTAWQRLLLLARLVDRFLRDPSTKVLAEIRRNEKQLGATPDDQQRLRWEIDPGQAIVADDVDEDLPGRVVELRRRLDGEGS